MASAFSHIAVPVGLRIGAGVKRLPGRLLAVALLLSIAPDADVLGLRFGVGRESPWGHRGFTHSIFFALVVAALLTPAFKWLRSGKISVFTVSFLSMVSHGVLDACTNGGAGVAFFWPISNERYFFLWRVVEVSPISVTRFFTERAVIVLKSEILYIWAPCLIVGAAVAMFRHYRKRA